MPSPSRLLPARPPAVRRVAALGATLALLIGAWAPPSSADPTPPAARVAERVAPVVDCPPRSVMRESRGVVLLVPGTGSTSDEVFSWGYRPALEADGFATCTTELPDTGLGDFVEAADSVARAIRRTARLAGARISVVGHSQGGALPVWAVKFRPAVARRTEDVVSLAGPFGGTRLGNELCLLSQCATLAWQLRQGADHVAALAGAPWPRQRGHRVSVTSLAGVYDEIVRPQPQASLLPGGRRVSNVLLQDVCLADPSEHALILGSPVGYALTLDALTHRGPADARRVDAAVCQQTFVPNGDPAGSVAFLASVARFATGLADPRRWVAAEPAVPAYARRWVTTPRPSGS